MKKTKEKDASKEAKHMRQIITSESVNIGHPDKTCDYIADSFLDAALSQDPNSQMAVECAIKDNKLFIYGEATTKAIIDYELFDEGTGEEKFLINSLSIPLGIGQMTMSVISVDELDAVYQNKINKEEGVG